MSIDLNNQYTQNNIPSYPPTGDQGLTWEESQQAVQNTWESFAFPFGDSIDSWHSWWEYEVFHNNSFMPWFGNNDNYTVNDDITSAWTALVQWKDYWMQEDPGGDYPDVMVEIDAMTELANTVYSYTGDIFSEMSQFYEGTDLVLGTLDDFEFVPEEGFSEYQYSSGYINEFLNYMSENTSYFEGTNAMDPVDANEYWSQYFNTEGPGYEWDTWESVGAIELIELLNTENYLEIYGPLLQDSEIPFSLFMQEYGNYIPSYDPTLETMAISSQKDLRDEAFTAIQGKLEDSSMQSRRSGFESAYSQTESLNNIIDTFNTTMSSIDTQTDASIAGYQQGFYNDFLAHLDNLTNLGAFNYDTYFPSEPIPDTDWFSENAQEWIEDMADSQGLDVNDQNQGSTFFGWLWDTIFGCDERLKKNVKYLETTESGVNIYQFNYIDSSYGTGTWIGPMAQEVPYAAKEINGVLYVDTRQLPDDVPIGRIGD